MACSRARTIQEEKKEVPSTLQVPLAESKHETTVRQPLCVMIMITFYIIIILNCREIKSESNSMQTRKIRWTLTLRLFSRSPKGREQATQASARKSNQPFSISEIYYDNAMPCHAVSKIYVQELNVIDQKIQFKKKERRSEINLAMCGRDPSIWKSTIEARASATWIAWKWLDVAQSRREENREKSDSENRLSTRLCTATQRKWSLEKIERK